MDSSVQPANTVGFVAVITRVGLPGSVRPSTRLTVLVLRRRGFDRVNREHRAALARVSDGDEVREAPAGSRKTQGTDADCRRTGGVSCPAPRVGEGTGEPVKSSAPRYWAPGRAAQHGLDRAASQALPPVASHWAPGDPARAADSHASGHGQGTR